MTMIAYITGKNALEWLSRAMRAYKALVHKSLLTYNQWAILANNSSKVR
jgi:hypothetical protein